MFGHLKRFAYLFKKICIRLTLLAKTFKWFAHPFNALGKTFKRFAYPFKRKPAVCSKLTLRAEAQVLPVPFRACLHSTVHHQIRHLSHQMGQFLPPIYKCSSVRCTRRTSF